MLQKTLKTSVQFSGIGLHYGKNINLTLKPAAENSGYKFIRTDLDNLEFDADVFLVSQTLRNTELSYKHAKVSTVEHLLSAIRSNGIDNIIIELDGEEIPILDGSAKLFSDKIIEAGLVDQKIERSYFAITEPIHYRDEKTGAELMAFPDENFSVQVFIDFNSPYIGQQSAFYDQNTSYVDEIAPNRTFVFVNELEMLYDSGLIRGGNFDNALVIANEQLENSEYEHLKKKFNQSEFTINSKGLVNQNNFYFSNELARHKLLDVLGDLSLIGQHLKARIIAIKPGHEANINFAKLIKRAYELHKSKEFVPVYTPGAKPVMDVLQIMKKLPHRYPFLLVDAITEISDQHIIGFKQITMNEWFFQGHFPENPVFPGVLQIEAMAQTGGVWALRNVPEGEIWDTYFIKIENCKFKDKVLPGDTLMLSIVLLEPMRRGIVRMGGKCYVGNKKVSEAELTAFVQKRPIG